MVYYLCGSTGTPYILISSKGAGTGTGKGYFPWDETIRIVSRMNKKKKQIKYGSV